MIITSRGKYKSMYDYIYDNCSGRPLSPKDIKRLTKWEGLINPKTCNIDNVKMTIKTCPEEDGSIMDGHHTYVITIRDMTTSMWFEMAWICPEEYLDYQSNVTSIQDTIHYEITKLRKKYNK